MARGDKLTRLLRYLRASRPSADPSRPGTVTAIEPTGTYDDWTERFIALTDHTGVVARTSAIPVLVGIGDDLDQLYGQLKESSDEMGSWRPLSWPSWPDSAILIDGALKMFELLENVLAAAVGGGGAAVNAPLEKAWNESTVVLFKEAAQLKGEFIAGVRVVTDEIDPEAR